ncbi:MAG: hypothetical protein E7676_01070 [Ruminococcaceae bacterium]|nr:hypothetical protein [Oscillospiraceae bacterium]
MTMILDLLRLQIDNKTDLFKTATPKKMASSLIKALLGLIVGIVGVAVLLSRVFILGFYINAQLLAIVLLVLQAVSICFAVGHIVSTLYMCHDNEMLICLPITPNQLFISKIMLIYCKELGVNAIISLPLMISLGLFGGFGASFYLSVPLLLLVMPFFSIAVAALISLPVMAVIRFLKPRPLLSIIVILILVAACLFGYLSLISSFAESFNIADKQLETVREINATVLAFGGKIPIYFQCASAMLSFGKWYYFAIYLTISAVVFIITTLLIRPFFFKIAMTSLENTSKEKQRKGRFKKCSPFLSLIDREIRCIFRSPTDIFEYFLFTLLMPFIVFSYDKLLMTITVNQAGVNMIAGSHVMIVAILAMLSNIVSASAISREGSNFHTTKTIPVTFYEQIFAKLTFNAIFTLGALLLTMLVSFSIYPAWQIILGTISVSFASIGHIAWSIDMDIKNPTINLQGNEEASSTSKSTPKSLLIGLVIGFLMGLLVIMYSGGGNPLTAYLLLIVASIIFALYRVWTLILRINLCYEKIEM